MARYRILYWYDIPAGVRAEEGGTKVTRHLPPRFQAVIDAAATEAGLTEQEAYLAGWRWGEPQERPGEPQAVAEAVTKELEAAWTAQRLRQARQRLVARLAAGRAPRAQ